MALRLDYLARETGQNLVRNPLTTIATVTTVAVSLAMLTVTVLLGQGISNAFERWNNDVSFILYVNPDADQAQVDSLQKDLDGQPAGVRGGLPRPRGVLRPLQDPLRGRSRRSSTP